MSREGQAVLLSGEAGIGKSRLMAALAERLSAEPHAELRCFCSPYHVNSALHPLIAQLERAAGFSSDDSADKRLDKLEALLGSGGANIDETLPLLAALLSIDVPGRYVPPKLPAAALRARTLAALARLVEAPARSTPVLVLVEDAHWIDPTTTEWLEMVVERLAELPVLLIVTARPEFEPRWKALSHVAVLLLGRLEVDQGAAIMERVAGGKKLPSEIADRILANTEGVPLFVEELTRTVLDSGLLVEAGDRYLSNGPLPAIAIPSTLQDSLMARLDRLSPVKETAQIGACIGRVFHHRLLAAVSGTGQGRLDDALRQLERAELVFRSGAVPEATYTFKHALVRDTAYQSLLKSRRQQIHGKIAATLEAEFGDIAEAEPESVAQHYTLGGMAAQAVPWWLKAGQRALNRSAHHEAAAHFAKGLELVASLPASEDRLRQQLSLQTSMGSALIPAKGWGDPEVLNAFSRARMLAESLGDKAQLFAAVRGESSCRTISGDLRVAEALALQCHTLGMELAQASGDSAYMLEAHHQLWGANFYLGNYSTSEIHANRGMAIYDYDRHRHLAWGYTGHDPGVCCRAFSAQMLCMRGRPDQAVSRSWETMALAERDEHPFTMAQAQLSFSFVQLMRREFVEARFWADKGVSLCTELVMPLVLGQARAYLGWALAGLGHLADGIREMREGIAIISETGADMGTACYLCALAQAYRAHGEAEEGLAVLDRAFATLARTDSIYQLPELLRAKGELLLSLDPRSDEAESWFQRSLDAARSQGVLASELRAALGLARLYADRGRDGEAKDLLAPVHAGFGEGFDTPDLIEAKSLLQKLSDQATAPR
jgi:predicted ATPase